MYEIILAEFPDIAQMTFITQDKHTTAENISVSFNQNATKTKPELKRSTMLE